MTTTDAVTCRLLGCDDTRHHCRPHRVNATTSADASADADADTLLSALAHARAVHEQARTRLRQLLAYGREFTYPRPYTLAALAAAADMSISGVRTGYDHDDITAVAQALNTPPVRGRS